MSSPEVMSRMPLRRSHQTMFAPSSGRGRPKLGTIVLGFHRYPVPIQMIPSAASRATPIENQCMRASSSGL